MKTYDYTKLKGLREEKGLSQKDVGELLGIGQSAYNKLEKGNRKRKNDSILDIEKLAEAFGLTTPRLISILTNQEKVRDSGIKEADLWQIHQLTKENPIREDEFILFSTDILELEKHDFKAHYSGINLNDYGDNLCRHDNGMPLDMSEYPPVINIIKAIGVEIGFDYENKKLKGISIWLGDKKLGMLDKKFIELANQLINSLLISRVVIIENEDAIAGYFQTYMKVVFIASNAVCKSSAFEKGRFKQINLMTKEEIEEAESEY